MRLEALFRPKSIAVVGASDKPTIGRRLIASLDCIGFAGPIFPINPNYSAVSGRQCYANIAELPETPMSRCSVSAMRASYGHRIHFWDLRARRNGNYFVSMCYQFKPIVNH